jgi:ABC-2 type transport system permease protein
VRAFRRYSTYRSAALAGCFTNTVFGFIQAYVLLALWHQRPSLGGYDATDAVTYAFLTQALLAPSGIFGTIDLSQRIRTGDIVIDLYRPLDFQAYWFANEAGHVSFLFLARSIPPAIVGAIAFRVVVPHSPLVCGAFALSTLLAVLLGFALRYAVALSAFWLFDDRGAVQVAATIAMFFSGFLVPLTIFPGALGTLARVLPYGGVIQVPIDVLLGKRHGTGLLSGLGYQLGWTVVVLLLGRYVTYRARLRLEVQGG